VHWTERRQVQTLEGDWKPKRIVVTEFPRIEQARRWSKASRPGWASAK
jgi:uncharacterized protein (DUF1330 family)